MRELLKLRDVCKILGVSRRTALRWIYSGKLNAFKVGGRLWRIRERDLVRFTKSGSTTRAKFIK
jgi:excisionase family DNA binding protein